MFRENFLIYREKQPSKVEAKADETKILAGITRDFQLLAQNISSKTDWTDSVVGEYIEEILQFAVLTRELVREDTLSTANIQQSILDLFRHLHTASNDKVTNYYLYRLAYPIKSLVAEMDKIPKGKWDDHMVYEFWNPYHEMQVKAPKVDEYLKFTGALPTASKARSEVLLHLYEKIKDEPNVSSDLKEQALRHSMVSSVSVNVDWIPKSAKSPIITIYEDFRDEISKVDPRTIDDAAIAQLDWKASYFAAKCKDLIMKAYQIKPEEKNLWDIRFSMIEGFFYRVLYDSFYLELPAKPKYNTRLKGWAQKSSNPLAELENYTQKISAKSRMDLGEKIAGGGPKRKPRPKQKGKFVDPMLSSPFGGKRVSSLESPISIYDNAMEDFFLNVAGYEKVDGEWNMDPYKRFIAGIMYTSVFGPLKDHLASMEHQLRISQKRDLNNRVKVGDVLQGEYSKEYEVHIRAEYLTTQLAYKLARLFMKKVLHKMDPNELHTVIAGMYGMLEEWKSSMVALIGKTAVVAIFLRSISYLIRNGVQIAFGINVWREIEKVIEEATSLGLSQGTPINASVISSLTSLGSRSVRLLTEINKRDPMKVAKERPKNTKYWRRLHIITHFLLHIKTSKKWDRDTLLFLDFAISILSRMKDDNELVQMSDTLRMPLMYLFSIPDFKDQVLDDPQIQKIIKLQPDLTSLLVDAFVPTKPTLPEVDEEKFNEIYGKPFEVLHAILKIDSDKIPVDAKYLITFCMENIKSHFGTEDKYYAKRLKPVLIAILEQNKSKIPVPIYAKAIELLQQFS